MERNSLPKIAQVVCTYPPYHGGMGRVAFEYTERLRERGYNVHVFTSLNENVEQDPEYVHRIPAILQIGNAGVMPSLYKRLSGFDLIHLHYPFFGGAEPVIVRKAIKHNQGLVMTYHMDTVSGGLKGMFFEVHKHVMFPWIVNRADRILISSKDYFESSALAKIESVKDRVEIHPFGVDLKRFYPGDESEFLNLQSIPKNVPCLLFVGGLDSPHYFKGLNVLIDTMSELKDIPWHLVVVGDGDLRKMYESQSKVNGLQNRISFVGSVSDNELPKWYRACDFHVFPSTRKAEAFGMVALEAAASGIPTIATRLPGVRSVVLDGATGLLVEPEDVKTLKEAIVLLLTRIDVREQFGRAARARAESEFAWEPIILKLEQTYKSVLDQESKREYGSVQEIL